MGAIENVMANQRDKNKVMVGMYIDRETRDTVKEILASRGITMTDFIAAQFYKLLKKEEDEILQSLELRDGRTKKSKDAKKNKAGNA